MYLLPEKKTNYFPSIEFHIIMWNKIVFCQSFKSIKNKNTNYCNYESYNNSFGYYRKFGVHLITQVLRKYIKKMIILKMT